LLHKSLVRCAAATLFLSSLCGCHRPPSTIAAIPRVCGTLLWESLRSRALMSNRSPDGMFAFRPQARNIPVVVADISLKLPSWWTPVPLIWVLIGAALLVFIFTVLILRLQRWRLRAVLKERERLALDMHDTLAQSFAGIGFQLQAIRSETPELSPHRQAIETALAMVYSSHEEAKRSISALRPGYLGDGDLLQALAKYAERLADGQSTTISTSVEGVKSTVPLQTSDAFFRIGQEAVSNAMRHSGASMLSLALAFEPEFVTITIRDNGCGFSTDYSYAGLGLRGMEKRACDVGAQIEIVSSPRSGTTVRVKASIRPRMRLSRHVESVLDFIAGE
jgi:signal transduction histidine kinase